MMMRRHLVAAGLLALALGCATPGALLDPGVQVSPDELLSGAALETGPPLAVASEDEVLALSPEMHDFLEANVHAAGNAFLTLDELVHAIISDETFGLVYDETTRTAAETFAVRRGNCLSFSTMFVALARGAGLKVQFQEVDIPPDWTLRDDAYVLNRHVNVVVALGMTGEHVVDFNIDDFRASYERRSISDTRAMAHYYNNIGVERMQAGDTGTAFACFRKALADNDRRFSPAWTNLATLYLRAGRAAHAEAAYLQALEVDADDLVAMSNLAGLYERSGATERAAHYRAQVVQHRNQNPYYRYHVAREAFFARDYAGAIRHLRQAVRRRPQEDQFWFLLGLCHLQQGNLAAARTWLAKAEEVAATEALKRNYSSKIDALLSR